MSWGLEAEKVPARQQAECPGKGRERGRAHLEEGKEHWVFGGSEPWEEWGRYWGAGEIGAFGAPMTMARLLRAQRAGVRHKRVLPGPRDTW